MWHFNQKRKFNCVFFLRWWNILYNSKLRFLKIQHGQKKGWRWISINLFLLNKRKYYKVSNKKSQVLNLIDRDFEKTSLSVRENILYTSQWLPAFIFKKNWKCFFILRSGIKLTHAYWRQDHLINIICIVAVIKELFTQTRL